MIDIEIPVGKRKLSYRLFEMLPAALSYGALALLVILSIIDPLYAAIYLIFVIITLIVKAIGIAIHTIRGNSRLTAAQKINWNQRLRQLESPVESYESLEGASLISEFGRQAHSENLRLMAADPGAFVVRGACSDGQVSARYVLRQ